MWKRILRAVLPARLQQSIQRRRLARVLANYPAKQVRHKYGDAELLVEIVDPLGEGWYGHDCPLLPEITLLRSGRLRPGALVFDLGAHQGVVALMLAREVGATGKVVAVEAHPHNARAARRNRDLNAMPWIEVVSAGAAATAGVIRLSRALNAQTAAASQYAGTFDVPAVTIDGLRTQFGQPDVIYVDVEGMELDVLRGATQSLEANPDVFVEVHTGCGLEAAGGAVSDVLAYFPAALYDCFIHTEAIPTPIRLTEAPNEWFRKRFFLTARKHSP